MGQGTWVPPSNVVDHPVGTVDNASRACHACAGMLCMWILLKHIRQAPVVHTRVCAAAAVAADENRDAPCAIHQLLDALQPPLRCVDGGVAVVNDHDCVCTAAGTGQYIVQCSARDHLQCRYLIGAVQVKRLYLGRPEDVDRQWMPTCNMREGSLPYTAVSYYNHPCHPKCH